MSVYSGFATRQQERRYNEYVECALAMLAKRLARFYLGETCNEQKFHHLLVNIHARMQQMEESKYHPPHFSHVLAQLIHQTAEVFDQVGHLSRMKEEEHSRLKEDPPSRMREEDPLSQTFSKLDDSHIRVKFNTLNLHPQNEEEDFDFAQQQPHRNSRKTLNQRKVNFKTRVKTITPEYHSKPAFFTPPKKSSLADPKRERAQKQQLAEAERSRPAQFGQIQRLEHSSKNRPLSPRQFLRQTVKGKETFSHLALRTKQKHQKLVKV